MPTPKPLPHRKKLGADGEILVQKHLESLGWQVLAVNFRCAQGEVDIVAEEPTPPGTTLVFIEVKTRRGGKHGSPIESVTSRKQARLFAVAQAFLSVRNLGGQEPACRFDIVEVFLEPDGLARIVLHRGIFGI